MRKGDSLLSWNPLHFRSVTSATVQNTFTYIALFFQFQLQALEWFSLLIGWLV